MAGEEMTTVRVPKWAFTLGKASMGILVLGFGWWLSIHDMQRDFAEQRDRVGALEARITELERRDSSRNVTDAAVGKDIAYVRETVSELKVTLERLAGRL